MSNLQYIGARYVPKFYENPDDQSNNWKSGVLYEALEIVTYNNDSYTSKKPVPEDVGNPADNPDYWACTTKYTAALIALQNTVAGIVEDIDDDIKPSITAISSDITDNIKPAITEIQNFLQNEDTIYTRLHDKHIIIVGDSLSMSSGWVELLGTVYGAHVHNYSVSGSAIAGSDPTSMASRIDAILAAESTCDYFVLQGGANDKNQDIPLGNIATTGNNAYFGAAIRGIIEKVFTKYGSAVKARVISTMHRFDNANTIGLNERAYIDMMGVVCSDMSVPFFDAWGGCGIELTGTTSMYDWADAGKAAGGSRTYHLSAAGSQHVLKLYASFIADMPVNNYLPSAPTLFDLESVHADLTLNKNWCYMENDTVFVHVDATASDDIAMYQAAFTLPFAAAPSDSSAQYVATVVDITGHTVSYAYLSARNMTLGFNATSGHRYVFDMNYRRR